MPTGYGPLKALGTPTWPTSDSVGTRFHPHVGQSAYQHGRRRGSVGSEAWNGSSRPTTTPSTSRRTTRGGRRRSGSRGWCRSASCSATSTRCSVPTSACSSAACSWSTTPPSSRGRSRSSSSGGTRRSPPGSTSATRSSTTACASRRSSPRRVFDFGYESRDLALDLRYEGVIAPLVTDATPPFNKGHIDQIGRVTGTMTLRGEEIAVDCFAMRDRRWGSAPGRPSTQGRVRVRHRVGPTHAFLSISIDQQGDDLVSSGFLQRDGEWSDVVAGRRTVERDERGRPAADHRRRHRRAWTRRCTRSAAW